MVISSSTRFLAQRSAVLASRHSSKQRIRAASTVGQSNATLLQRFSVAVVKTETGISTSASKNDPSSSISTPPSSSLSSNSNNTANHDASTSTETLSFPLDPQNPNHGADADRSHSALSSSRLSSSSSAPPPKQKRITQHLWTVNDFMSFDAAEWDKDRWMAACTLMFDDDAMMYSRKVRHNQPVYKSRLQRPFLEHLLDARHTLDEEQVEFVHARVLHALDHRNWTPEHRIFGLLARHACRVLQRPEQAERYLQHHIQLFGRGRLVRPPRRFDFYEVVHAWFQKHRQQLSQEQQQQQKQQKEEDDDDREDSAALQSARRIHQLIEKTWLPLFRKVKQDPNAHPLNVNLLRPLEIAYAECLQALCSCGETSLAQNMLLRIRSTADQDQFWPRAILFNTVMHGCAQRGQIHQVEALFKDMISDHQEGTNPYGVDAKSFGTLMTALKRNQWPNAAETNERLLNLLVDIYQENNFDQRFKPNSVLFSIVIDSWAKEVGRRPDAPYRATDVLRRMIPTVVWKQEKHHFGGVHPTMYHYNAVLNAWARAASPSKSKKAAVIVQNDDAPHELEALWAEFVEATTLLQPNHAGRFQPNRFSYMARINVWERSQRRAWLSSATREHNRYAAQRCMEILEEFRNDPHLEPFDGTGPQLTNMYNRVLYAAAKAELIKDVERLLNEMLEQYEQQQQQELSGRPEVFPDDSTLHFCITALSHSVQDEATEKVLEWFERLMEVPSVKPSVVTLNIMLSCLKRGADNSEKAEQAVSLLERFDKEYSIKPNNTTYNEALHCVFNQGRSSPLEQRQGWVQRIQDNMALWGMQLSPTKSLQRVHREALGKFVNMSSD